MGFGNQPFLVPVFGHDLLECLEVTLAHRLDLVELVGHTSHCLDRDRGAGINSQPAPLLEHAVTTPGQEVKLARIGIEVDEEIVPVGGVSVPEAEQSLDGPEPVERIQVDQFTDGLFHVDFVGLDLGENQHVGAGWCDIESVDGEYVFPLAELVSVLGDVESLELLGLGVVVSAGGPGIPADGLW